MDSKPNQDGADVGKAKSRLTTGTGAINMMAEVGCYVLLALEVEDGFLGQRCKT